MQKAMNLNLMIQILALIFTGLVKKSVQVTWPLRLQLQVFSTYI